MHSIGIELILLLHVDHQLLLAAQTLDHQGDDDRHEGHVTVSSDGNGTQQVGSKLDGGEDSRGTIGTSDDAQGTCLLRSKAHSQSHQEDREDTHLCCCTKDGKLEVAKHRTEVGQGSHTHEDDGRQQATLDKRIIQVIHQA